jgi:hypothetical protein
MSPVTENGFVPQGATYLSICDDYAKANCPGRCLVWKSMVYQVLVHPFAMFQVPAGTFHSRYTLPGVVRGWGVGGNNEIQNAEVCFKSYSQIRPRDQFVQTPVYTGSVLMATSLVENLENLIGVGERCVELFVTQTTIFIYGRQGMGINKVYYILCVRCDTKVVFGFWTQLDT